MGTYLGKGFGRGFGPAVPGWDQQAVVKATRVERGVERAASLCWVALVCSYPASLKKELQHPKVALRLSQQLHGHQSLHHTRHHWRRLPRRWRSSSQTGSRNLYFRHFNGIDVESQVKIYFLHKTKWLTQALCFSTAHAVKRTAIFFFPTAMASAE